MAARVLQVCDAVVEAIEALWSPAAPDSVSRAYLARHQLRGLEGRQVTVHPAGYAWPALGTRGEDYRDCKVLIAVAERYTAAGDVTDAWLDDRVEWVQSIYDDLDDPRTSNLLGAFWPEESAITVVFDPDELEQRKLFLSVIEMTFRELA